MKKTVAFVLITVVILVLSGTGWAQSFGTAFTYQGRLMDANSPADGLYDFQFDLYSDPCLSYAAYKVGDTITIDELDVIDGYFTAELDFGTWGVFTGDARWLQIGVRPGEMSDPAAYTILSPRQEVTPAPYAIYAASGPGIPVPLVLSGSSPDPIISATNFGAGSAVYGKATNTGEEDNHGGYFESAGSDSSGVYGKATGQEGMGVYGYASNMGDVTNYGGYFIAAGKYGRAVYGEGTGESARGVWGETSGKYGIGVQGTASGENSFGVYGFTSGSSGKGVYGYASKTGEVENYGGYFVAAGDHGRAVYGKATAVGGIWLQNYGGYFEAAGVTGIGVLGESTGAAGAGVRGRTLGGQGIAVMGEAPNEADAMNYGGQFKAAGGRGRGVYAEASGAKGIAVLANGEDYDFYAAGDGINYGASSSIRWKSDVRSIDEPLEKVMNLRGVYFNWDAEHGGEHDVGMIAEEVGKVLPEIVSYEDNGIDATGMDYGKLTPLLIEAVKSLKKEADVREKQQAEKYAIIERLEQENQALSKRLAAIESLVEQLGQDGKELKDAAF